MKEGKRDEKRSNRAMYEYQLPARNVDIMCYTHVLINWFFLKRLKVRNTNFSLAAIPLFLVPFEIELLLRDFSKRASPLWFAIVQCMRQKYCIAYIVNAMDSN